jgi:hypothetical protein
MMSQRQQLQNLDPAQNKDDDNKKDHVDDGIVERLIVTLDAIVRSRSNTRSMTLQGFLQTTGETWSTSAEAITQLMGKTQQVQSRFAPSRLHLVPQSWAL